MSASSRATRPTTRGRCRRARSSGARSAARDYGKVGLELSLGTQASDRMVGEPTTFTKAWFDAWPDASDATPRPQSRRARSSPTQEVERMRLANEICAAAMEHVARELTPGMKESEAAAIWQGFVHGEGTGWRRAVDLALPLLARLVGAGDPTFTATGDRARAGRPADAVRDLGLRRRLLGGPHEAPLPGRAARRLPRARAGLLGVYEPRDRPLQARRVLRRARSARARRARRIGYPGQPTHPICHGVGARAHEPPYAHQAGGGEIERGHGARDRAGRATGRAAAACASRTTS